MLRFLVDLRGEEVDNKQARVPSGCARYRRDIRRDTDEMRAASQMRDDLITLLIAGHETTAAVLTWLTFALIEYPDALATARKEIDEKARGDPPRYPPRSRRGRCEGERTRAHPRRHPAARHAPL